MRIRRAVLAVVVLATLAACAPMFEAGATLGVTTTGGAVLLRWPAASDPDEGEAVASYRIDVDGVEVARVPASVRSCQLWKLPAGTHQVSVTAYDDTGEWSGDLGGDLAASGRLTASVSGPTSDPAGAVAGCGSFGVTDQQQLADQWAAVTAALPAHGATSNVATCSAGTTSSAYRSGVLAKVNAYRALSGVAAATESSTYTADAQKAALIMAANGALNHNPPTTWACYTAAGASGASTSNLGSSGGSTSTIDGVRQYVRDAGAGNNFVGHRRWVLCPGTSQVGLGKVPTTVSGIPYQFDAMKIMPSSGFGNATQARDRFIAWPPPGLFPIDLATPLGLHERWSVMVPQGHTTASAQVTVTGPSGAVTVTELVRDDILYCAPAVVWKVGQTPVAGETWTVAVTGLKDAGGTSYARIWTVTFTNLG